MMSDLDQLREAAALITAASGSSHASPPRIAIVTGSGLGGLADALESPVATPMADLPGFGRATVAGHQGRWITGRLAGAPVHVLQGRRHFYEGADPAEVVAAVRVAALLGVRLLILTNAAGGVATRLRAGDLMLIRDQINLQFRNPLVGPNPDALGPRFPDMSEPFSEPAAAMIRAAARRAKLRLAEGVYASVAGPNYETRAEIAMLRRLGADAVGMSTVPEVLAARHAGLRVAALATITNVPYRGAPVPTTHAEVLDVAATAQSRLLRLLEAAIPSLARLVESPMFGAG